MGIIGEGLRILHEEGIRAFIRKALSYALSSSSALGYIISPLIVKKFKEAIRDIDDVHDALNFAFSFQAFGVSIKPIQVKYEIAKLLEIVAELQAESRLRDRNCGRWNPLPIHEGRRHRGQDNKHRPPRRALRRRIPQVEDVSL